jgi:hypothetical protein
MRSQAGKQRRIQSTFAKCQHRLSVVHLPAVFGVSREIRRIICAVDLAPGLAQIVGPTAILVQLRMVSAGATRLTAL